MRRSTRSTSTCLRARYRARRADPGRARIVRSPARRGRVLTPIDRHAQRVWEAAARTSPGTVFSHASACALWGIDTLGGASTSRFGDRVDISVERTSGGRTTGNLRRHTADMTSIDVLAWGDHWITTPSQTMLDMAATLPFTIGVVAADQGALGEAARQGRLLSLDALRTHAERYRGRGRRSRARRVAEFATAESDSVRESQSRVVLDGLGFAAPELQHRFVAPGRQGRPHGLLLGRVGSRRRVRRRGQVHRPGDPARTDVRAGHHRREGPRGRPPAQSCVGCRGGALRSWSIPRASGTSSPTPAFRAADLGPGR